VRANRTFAFLLSIGIDWSPRKRPIKQKKQNVGLACREVEGEHDGQEGAWEIGGLVVVQHERNVIFFASKIFKIWIDVP
jgi:hypothetical protein